MQFSKSCECHVFESSLGLCRVLVLVSNAPSTQHVGMEVEVVFPHICGAFYKVSAGDCALYLLE